MSTKVDVQIWVDDTTCIIDITYDGEGEEKTLKAVQYSYCGTPNETAIVAAATTWLEAQNEIERHRRRHNHNPNEPEDPKYTKHTINL